MKVKHTPGPWESKVSIPNKRIEIKSGFRLVATLDVLYPEMLDPADIVDTALICAAPEMLTALQMVKSALEGASAPSREAYGLLEVYEAICKVMIKLDGSE